MVTLFGTDGVRGLVNSTLMPELAYQLGRAAGAYFCKSGKSHRFLIGMDTRVSGPMLTAAISAGLCASGIDVDIVGVIPTPGVAYLTKTEGYDAGVVISASHNPFPDNGIKFFDKRGTNCRTVRKKKLKIFSVMMKKSSARQATASERSARALNWLPSTGITSNLLSPAALKE